MPVNMFDSSSSASSSVSSETSTVSMTGTRLARFVNGYSPIHDKPYTHLELNSDVFLDGALSDMLTEDRRMNVQNHLLADKAFKEYVASRMQNSSSMRS